MLLAAWRAAPHRAGTRPPGRGSEGRLESIVGNHVDLWREKVEEKLSVGRCASRYFPDPVFLPEAIVDLVLRTFDTLQGLPYSSYTTVS
jgi:hypothetical protein